MAFLGNLLPVVPRSRSTLLRVGLCSPSWSSSVSVTPCAAFHQTNVLALVPLELKNTNRRFRFKAWQQGFWVEEGARAQIGSMIYRQRYLRFHPGEHVAIDDDYTLVALEPGTVFVTTEIINPNLSHRFAKEAYEARKGQTIFRKFVHIKPDPLPLKFKLVAYE